MSVIHGTMKRIFRNNLSRIDIEEEKREMSRGVAAVQRGGKKPLPSRSEAIAPAGGGVHGSTQTLAGDIDSSRRTHGHDYLLRIMSMAISAKFFSANNFSTLFFCSPAGRPAGRPTRRSLDGLVCCRSCRRRGDSRASDGAQLVVSPGSEDQIHRQAPPDSRAPAAET